MSGYGLDFDWVRKEAARIAAGVGPGTGGSKLRDFVNYDWRDGQNIIRLFPPSKQPGSSFLAKLVFQHHKVGPEKESVLCYENTYPESRFQCPLCVVIKELTAGGVDAWSHGSRGRAVTNVIDRWDESKGPQIIRMPMMVYNWIIQQVATQNIDVTNPYNGADLIITKSGKNLQTDYVSSFRIVNGNVACAAGTAEQIEKWLGMLFDMNSMNKNKDWNSEDGRKELAKLQNLAAFLRRQYLGDGTVPGGFQPPALGLPVPAPPPPVMAPPVPAVPLPPVLAASPVQVLSPNVVTASATLHPVAPLAQQVAQAAAALPPPPPLVAPAPPVAAAPPPVMAPPMVQSTAAPQPAVSAPVAPPVASVPAVAAPSVTATSSDSRPLCYGKPSSDLSVEYSGVKGGYQVGEYRCMMCQHEMACSAVAVREHPELYPGVGTK